jgi:hypothetical protein
MKESTEQVEGLRPPGEPARQADRPTRKRLPFWDRVKFLFLFAIAWLVLVWATIADFPGGMPFAEAALIQLTEARWLLILAGVELLRQLHFLVSEFWSGYHRFWTHRVFGGFERVTHRRLSDWTRFRLARMLKWLF